MKEIVYTEDQPVSLLSENYMQDLEGYNKRRIVATLPNGLFELNDILNIDKLSDTSLIVHLSSGQKFLTKDLKTWAEIPKLRLHFHKVVD